MKYVLSKYKFICTRKIKYFLRKKTKKAVLMYPKTIQLPITYLCNFDCVMCGMHHMTKRHDFTAEQLKTILSDKLFSEVESVGVNGGEPFLKPDILACFEAMIDSLPKLNSFYIISNGYFTQRIFENLCEIKKMCGSRGIKIYLSISVDGIGEMQDFHRGRKGAFENAQNTIRLLCNNKDKCLDSINIICTITKYNIERINEVEVWADQLKIDVSYNIATENIRIENEDRVENFSVLYDEHAKMLAMEFFHKKYFETKEEKYYALFLFLRDGKRYAECPCMYNEWITLTPNAQIGFCATHSKELGSALDKSAYQIVQQNMTYLEELKQTYCDKCSHYSNILNAEGYSILSDEIEELIYMH